MKGHPLCGHGGVRVPERLRPARLAPTIAGAILVETADKKLEGFGLVGFVSAGAAAMSLFLAGFLRPAAIDVPKTEPVKRADAAEPDPACHA